MMEVRTKPLKPQEVTFMFNTNERNIKHKVGLLNLAEDLGNVSEARQVMGLFRDTFYCYKSAVEEGGVEALLEVAIDAKITRRIV